MKSLIKLSMALIFCQTVTAAEITPPSTIQQMDATIQDLGNMGKTLSDCLQKSTSRWFQAIERPSEKKTEFVLSHTKWLPHARINSNLHDYFRIIAGITEKYKRTGELTTQNLKTVTQNLSAIADEVRSKNRNLYRISLLLWESSKHINKTEIEKSAKLVDFCGGILFTNMYLWLNDSDEEDIRIDEEYTKPTKADIETMRTEIGEILKNDPEYNTTKEISESMSQCYISVKQKLHEAKYKRYEYMKEKLFEEEMKKAAEEHPAYATTSQEKEETEDTERSRINELPSREKTDFVLSNIGLLQIIGMPKSLRDYFCVAAGHSEKYGYKTKATSTANTPVQCIGSDNFKKLFEKLKNERSLLRVLCILSDVSEQAGPQLEESIDICGGILFAAIYKKFYPSAEEEDEFDSLEEGDAWDKNEEMKKEKHHRLKMKEIKTTIKQIMQHNSSLEI